MMVVASSLFCFGGFAHKSIWTYGPGECLKENVCHYCHEEGHWRAGCPMLKLKESYAGDGRLKPAALAASVPGSVNVGVWQLGHAETGVAGGANESFWPFVSEGFVTQTGREESILPFSEKTDNGDKVIMLGMGLKVLAVPVHRMNLNCDLVQGEVPIGVRPELQVEGVDIILGNSLVGSRVWTSGSSLPVLQAQNSHMIVRCAFLCFLHVQ